MTSKILQPGAFARHAADMYPKHKKPHPPLATLDELAPRCGFTSGRSMRTLLNQLPEAERPKPKLRSARGTWYTPSEVREAVLKLQARQSVKRVREESDE